jgi:Protein of unknown function (DUF3572).
VRQKTLTKDRAETIALEGLRLLAGSPDELERFLKLSGIDLNELRAKASDPDLLRAVLDHILTVDERVTELCEATGSNPQELHAAAYILGQP